jgi:cell division protein FtsZ
MEIPQQVAPVNAISPRVEVRPEPRYEAPVTKNTDYAVKSEITFDFDEPKTTTTVTDNRPKINWAEKLQNAASKYESQKNYEAPVTRQSPPSAPTMEARPELTHFDNSAPVENKNENSNQNRESRIKSIAEKLGFFNFDEDEFDTPSFMKKNERNHDSQI